MTTELTPREALEEINRLNRRLKEAEARAEANAKQVEELAAQLEHCRYWYNCRFERLHQFAREEMPEELRVRYHSIVANGTADSSEHPTYAQQYNMLKHRAELAEARAEAAEKRMGVYKDANDAWKRGEDLIAAENRRLRAALEAVEWVARGTRVSHRICPWCFAFMHLPHKPDCQRQLALQPAESKGETT